MPEQTTQNTRVASNARDPSARHSGVHLTGRETGTRLTECAPILKGGHPNKAPASPLGSILIPGSQARKAGCTHGSVGGRGVITGLPLSHSGKPVHLSPSLSLLCNQQVETTRPCPRPKGTPFRPRVNLAGPEGPGPASLSLAVPSAIRGRAAVARGKGQRLRDPRAFSLRAKEQTLTAVPTPTDPLSGDSLPQVAAAPAQDPHPRDHAPCSSLTHAQYLPRLATLPLSSVHPILSWAVHPSTPRPHLKGQKHTGLPQGLNG